MTAPLVRDRSVGVTVARPLFQVLRDDAQQCVCHAWRNGAVCSPIAMTVTAADYNREGAVFL